MANLLFGQANSNSNFSNVQSVATSFASSTGSSLLLALTQYIGTSGNGTLTDTLGNAWNPIGTPLIAGNTTTLWAAQNKPGGGAVTFTFTAPFTNGFNVIGVAEYFNQLVSPGPIDLVSGFTSSVGITATSPTITTGGTNETLIAWGVNGDALASTVGAGYTLRLTGSGAQVVLEDQFVAAIGNYNATWTQTNAGWKTAILAVRGQNTVIVPPSGGDVGPAFDFRLRL